MKGGGPSKEAIEAAIAEMPDVYALVRSDQSTEGYPDLTYAPLDKRQGVPHVLKAACDPALGLDRLVCLRDVVDFVNELIPEECTPAAEWAEAIEREFGGGS